MVMFAYIGMALMIMDEYTLGEGIWFGNGRSKTLICGYSCVDPESGFIIDYTAESNPVNKGGKKDFVNEVIDLFNTHISFEKYLDLFIYRNYLTVIEKYLFFSPKICYKDKVKYINHFIDSINKSINYKNIDDKKSILIRHRMYAVIYYAGIILGVYKK